MFFLDKFIESERPPEKLDVWHNRESQGIFLSGLFSFDTLHLITIDARFVHGKS